MKRRDLLAGGMLFPVAGAGALDWAIKPAAAESVPFDGGAVRALARDLAAKPYQAPQSKLPDPFSKLGYDQYRDIRYNLERMTFADSGFELQGRLQSYVDADKLAAGGRSAAS